MHASLRKHNSHQCISNSVETRACSKHSIGNNTNRIAVAELAHLGILSHSKDNCLLSELSVVTMGEKKECVVAVNTVQSKQ